MYASPLADAFASLLFLGLFISYFVLSVRMAWDWVLWSYFEQNDNEGFSLIRARFLKQFDHFPELAKRHAVQQKTLWVGKGLRR